MFSHTSAFASSSELLGIICICSPTCNPPSITYPFHISWLKVPGYFSPFMVFVTFEHYLGMSNETCQVWPDILISTSVTSFSFLSFDSTVCKLCILADWANNKDHVSPFLALVCTSSTLHLSSEVLKHSSLVIKDCFFKVERLGVAPVNLV